VIASNTPEEAKENATVIELLNSSDAPVAGEVVPVVNETVIVDTVIENDRSESKVEDKKHKPNDFVILDQKIEIEIERRNKEEGEILSYDPGFIQVEVWKHLNKRAYAAHINKMVKKASLIIRLDKKEKKQRARFKKSQEEALIIKNRADEKRLLELTSDLSFGMDDNTEIGIKIKEESVQVENSVLEEIQNDE
jgi:hypothetical protein